MQTVDFVAQVKAFAEKTKEAQIMIARDSTQDLIADAQLDKGHGGRMPVDTGNLRNSLVSGLNGATGTPGYTATIAGMEAGDVARFAWTADYAMRMEYGFVGPDSLGRVYNQAGNYFVGGAVAKWQSIVAANAEKHR